MRGKLSLLLLALWGFHIQASSHFPRDYDSSRSRFTQDIIKSGGKHEKIKIESKVDNDLSIDVAYYPAKKEKSNLIILISGTHGPESYLGTAALDLFLKKHFKNYDRQNTGYLLIHALNPYGFKYRRRGNENNIDLNRNLGFDESLFKSKNFEHAEMLSVVRPEEKVVSRSYLPVVWGLIKKLTAGVPMRTIRNGITSGQYEYPKSLYYGGHGFSQQRGIFLKLLKQYVPEYKKILSLDFHTGLGEMGQLHLISGNRNYLNNASIEGQGKIFFDKSENYYKLTTSDTPGFYPTTGDVNDFVARVAGKDKYVVALTAEFGTMGISLFHQVLTINNMIKENQGHFFGYKNYELKEKVKKAFISTFYPEDIEWRKSVIDKLDRIFSVELKNFSLSKTIKLE